MLMQSRSEKAERNLRVRPAEQNLAGIPRTETVKYARSRDIGEMEVRIIIRLLQFERTG